MHRSAPLAASFVVLIAASSASGQVVAERIAQGLSFPVFATTPPEDASRLFVVEQAGVIRLIKNDVLLSEPFLDISASVNTTSNEQGFLGLAFHPSYATNGRFFVYYIGGTGSGTSTILRFQVSANPDSADENSGTAVFALAQPFFNHNGGTIRFGHDGYLYLGLGDGGGTGDPSDRAQDGMELLGKMLRLDVDGGDDLPGDPNNNYAIPTGNPYVTDPLVRDEIWAFGLRNPYRWSFDRLTGDFWIGDVGQNCFEEISFHPDSVGTENYGWDVMEGPDCFENENTNACNDGPCGTGLVDPVHWTAHPAGPIAVTGGHVYRGPAIPSLQGEYLFGEFYTGQIVGLRFDGTAVTDTTDWTAQLDPPGSDINLVTAIEEDADGELYIVDADGEIFRIVAESTGSVVEPPAPRAFGLGPPVPNPFRTSTRFTVAMDRAADLDVSVFAADGRRVRGLHRGFVTAGELPLEWHARGEGSARLPAGVYYVRAGSEGRVVSSRVVLLR